MYVLSLSYHWVISYHPVITYIAITQSYQWLLLIIPCVGIEVLVIPQYKYNIIIITQVRGKAEDVGNNCKTL